MIYQDEIDTRKILKENVEFVTIFKIELNELIMFRVPRTLTMLGYE